MAHLVLPNGKGHGWKPDTPDHRDKLLREHKPRASVTEPLFLAADALPKVRDQGELGSCTGFGTSGAMMYRTARRKRPTELSALFAYYQARLLEANVKSDDGAEIRDAVKGAANAGVALEKCWPYDVRKFARTPTRTALRSATAHQAVGYYRCLNVDDINAALSKDMPVVIGFSCFSNLAQADGNGYVPLPGVQDRLEGGHCVWVCGTDPRQRVLKFQNSWSERWGDRGFGYLPYAYVEKGLADDMWALDHEP